MKASGYSIPTTREGKRIVAHKPKVKRVPHINANGTLSKKVFDYMVSCQSRGKTCFTASYSNKKDAEGAIERHRAAAFQEHRFQHPNDSHHFNKHKGADAIVTKKQPRKLRGRRPGEKYLDELRALLTKKKEDGAA